MTPGPVASAVFRPTSRREPGARPMEPTPRHADTLPFQAALLTSASPTHEEDRAGPANDAATMRMSALTPADTQPIRRPSELDTVQMDPVETAATRPFRRGEDLPGGDAANTATGVGLRTPAPLETGVIGSVQVGPKIFQLAAPPVGPTSTGTLPTPVRVDPVAATQPASSALALPMDTPRPGIYRLPEHRLRGAQEPRVTVSAQAEESTAPALEPALSPATATPPPCADGREPSGALPSAVSTVGLAAATPPPGLPPAVVRLATGIAAPPAGPQVTSPGPAATAARRHSPGLAACMSVLVPGLGQVYNGQRTRGILFALGTPLVLPYLLGIYDAFRTALDIVRHRYAAPDPHNRNTAYGGQVALGLVMIIGTIMLALLARRLPVSVAAPPPPAVPAPAPETAAPAPAAEIRPPLGDALDVSALMIKGRMACNQGMYSECEEIMHAIMARAPDNRDAYNLLVEAAQKRQRNPLPANAGLR